MNVIWTEESLKELEAIIDYIAADNPRAAHELGDSILVKVDEQLADNPNSGRPGRVEGTRELIVHAAYIVAYRVTKIAVEILTVRHAARLWPEEF